MNSMHIAIDPGHGGAQPGCSANGLIEKHLTLSTAQLLREMLEYAYVGEVNCELTRYDDTTLALSERGKETAAMNSNQVVVLHYDCSDDPKIGDLRTYYLEHDDVARILATEIEHCAPAELRGVVPQPVVALEQGWTNHAYNVLHPHAGRHPVLIECAYLSNPRHVAFLQSKFGLEGLATAIASAMLPVLRMWEVKQAKGT